MIDLRKILETDNSDIKELIINYFDSKAKIHDDKIQNKLLNELVNKYVLLEKKVDSLLKNTLPTVVANEIKNSNTFNPTESFVTILFTDFVGFTKLAEKIKNQELINFLDDIFTAFDFIIQKFNGTKIKTIGDSYMVVFGAPVLFDDHAEYALNAAVEMLDFVKEYKNKNFNIRIGIHSGDVIAGVVGKLRMQYDVFGDNVNIASRFESAAEINSINISEETYLLVKNKFNFNERGYIELKNKPKMKAYTLINKI